jgi:hypothetical protein
MTDKLRMDAYYYGFDSTGVLAVDKILSAVACAGKGFHNTEDWNDKCEWQDHTGETPVDWIQNAANEAADEIERLRAEVERFREALSCTHTVLRDSRLYLGYPDAGPLNTRFAEDAVRKAGRLLEGARP